jgi:IstB-like ATP binding protein
VRAAGGTVDRLLVLGAVFVGEHVDGGVGGRADIAPCAHRRLCPLRQPQENQLMERTQLFDLMGELKLYGMKAAFDEIMTTAIKRQHQPQRIVGDLLNAEISEKHARSIKYQLTIAKLPLAKDLDDFQFE